MEIIENQIGDHWQPVVGVGGMGGAIQFCNSGILQLLLLLMMAVYEFPTRAGLLK